MMRYRAPKYLIGQSRLKIKELAPYYKKAKLKMGVTGETTGMPHLPSKNGFKVLAAGAKMRGYKDIVSGPMAINSIASDGRPACQQIGFVCKAANSALSGRPCIRKYHALKRRANVKYGQIA